MEITLATPSHIPGLIDLLRQVGEVHHQIRPDIFRGGAQKYGEAELLNILADKSRPIFVAAEGETVLGYCFCIHRDYEGSSVLTDRREIYIDDLCVDEGCRGKGVAKALYDHVCGYAKQCGCAFITLNVWTGNDRAQHFYEKMGMKPRSVNMEIELC